MPKLSRKAGSTSETENIFVQDSSSTIGAGLTGLVYNSANLIAYYARQRTGSSSIALATLASTTAAFSSGGFKEIDSVGMKGWYRFDIPDACLASGSPFVNINLGGAANMAPVPLEIELTGWDNQDAVHGGFSCLPNTAVTTNGSLLTSGTGTAQLSVSSGQVILQSGTGTGQLDFTSGVVKANAVQWVSGTIPAVNVTGVPLVDAKYLLGTIFATPATAGILDANVKNINNVAATSVTAVNANIGTTQPVNYTGTGASALVKSDMVDIAGAAVSATSAQIGVNVVNWNNTVVATPATAGIPDVNAKNINNVSTSSVTTISANVGTTQPVNYTGTGASALVKSDVIDIAGVAVSSSSAQLGVNVVNWNGSAVTKDANNAPNVSAKYWAGTAIVATSIPVGIAAGAAGGVMIAGVNASVTFANLAIPGEVDLNDLFIAGQVEFQSTVEFQDSVTLFGALDVQGATTLGDVTANDVVVNSITSLTTDFGTMSADTFTTLFNGNLNGRVLGNTATAFGGVGAEVNVLGTASVTILGTPTVSILGTPTVTLAASQPLYAPAIAGNSMAFTTAAQASVVAATAAQITTDHGSGSYIRNTEPPTTSQIAAAILVTPANLLGTATDGSVSATVIGGSVTIGGVVTLAASQPNYAPAKAGDAMTLTGPTITSIQSGLATSAELDAVSLASDGLDAVVAAEGGGVTINFRQAQNLILAAAAAGRLSGADTSGGTNTIVIKDACSVTVTRITGTVDGAGNRSNVVINPPA